MTGERRGGAQPTRHVVVMGVSGSGKTTVARGISAATVIRARMARREGHYMPASLLESQLATLEPAQPDESVLVLDVSLAPQALVAAAVSGLGLSVPVTVGER
ncbi:hypothetical protein ACLQ28_13795 [Micromonospora sp. DT201]|uniref:hypothetical protein n=1 Tax=Micromonospora sp. DT201 TaxID=3393442 RepID=UPI003CF740AE